MRIDIAQTRPVDRTALLRWIAIADHHRRPSRVAIRSPSRVIAITSQQHGGDCIGQGCLFWLLSEKCFVACRDCPLEASHQASNTPQNMRALPKPCGGRLAHVHRSSGHHCREPARGRKRERGFATRLGTDQRHDSTTRCRPFLPCMRSSRLAKHDHAPRWSQRCGPCARQSHTSEPASTPAAHHQLRRWRFVGREHMHAGAERLYVELREDVLPASGMRRAESHHVVRCRQEAARTIPAARGRGHVVAEPTRSNHPPRASCGSRKPAVPPAVGDHDAMFDVIALKQ